MTDSKKIQHVDSAAANAHRAMAWRATYWADQYSNQAKFCGAEQAKLPPAVAKPDKHHRKAVRDIQCGELIDTNASVRATTNLIALIQSDLLMDGTQDGAPLGREADMSLAIELLQQIEGWLRPRETNDIIARERAARARGCAAMNAFD